MKKALGVFLMTAMAFGAFAEEPVADVKIAEFSGNASAQWGVDLDSGTTGFKNDYEVDLKLNLLNNGTKSTTGDGVWGELVLKTEKDTYIGWENGGDSAQVGDSYISANTGMMNRGNGANGMNLKVYVDVAKIHLGPAYIGIERDNTTTGKLKMDAAIRSADDDQAKWLDDVGPKDYSEGIVAGFENDMFKVDLDIRSKPATSKKLVNELVWVTKVTDQDGNAKETGAIDATDVLTLNNGKTVTGEDAGVAGVVDVEDVVNLPTVQPFPVDDATYYYTDNYAAALEGEFKGVENLSVKAGVSYNFAKNYQAQKADKNKTSIGNPQHTMGYSASLGYKLALDDTFFIRPQVGFAGTTTFGQNLVETKYVTSNSEMAAGLLFGWGEIGQDKDAGVYYLDDDMAKKVSPGVGVVAYIPFATTSKVTPKNTDAKKTTSYGSVAARIMPSLYTGELVPGLTAAAYGDIVVAKTGTGDDKTEYAAKDRATAMAFTFGAKYDIGVDEMTITPKFGLRFANAAYVNYKIEEKDDPVFAGMGDQKEKTEYSADGVTSAGNYMNLKLGVDVAGLIDNTTLSVTWQTDNILNEKDYGDGNGPKLGTLNFKAKIAL